MTIVPPTEGASTPPSECKSCVDVGRHGYCALGRCYCGHTDCHGFASYVNLEAIPLADAPTTTRRGRSSWDDREGATWIDQL